jgi:hypothetical protein
MRSRRPCRGSRAPRRPGAVGALIDTSIFAAVERGKLDLKAELGGRPGEWLGMAAITASELLAGVGWPGRPRLSES